MSVSGDTFAHHVSFRFRWVFCQLETLRRSVHRNLRGILKRLPKTLDETYERVLKEINDDNREHARRLLHCLAVAIRPLRVEELAEILAFNFDDVQGGIPKFRADWRWDDQEWAVLSTCSSLIAVVDSDLKFFGKCRVVQFSHFSVKEFLLSDRLASVTEDVSRYHILPGPAHIILAQACLGFLLHLDAPTDWKTGKRFPLARYAAQHWVEHAQFEDVASHVNDGMRSLFDPDKLHLAAWVGIYNIDDHSDYTPNPLYYAALCGFYDIVERLVIGHPQLINTLGGCNYFPVLAALVGKHIRVAEFLLQHGGKVNIKGEDGETALEMSIYSGLREDAFDRVSFLLNHGADVNGRANDGSTPLHTAAYVLCHEVVQLLLDSGADVDSRDDQGRTSLHLATAELECEEEAEARDILKLLLERGANANTQDNDGATPLLVAVRGRWVNISSLLLEHGAEPNMKNRDGESSLHQLLTYMWSPYNNSDSCGIARLLLGHGANVNDKDKDYTTPLHLAMKKGSYDVAQILLERGAEPNVANKDGNTPLHLILKAMLDYDEFLPDDDEVLTASLVRLLLEHGANVNAMDKDRTTPLLLAIQREMYEITRSLLVCSAEPNVKNNDGKTPLHLLLDGDFSNDDGIPDLARLLLDRGADVNAQDQNHATPLLPAVELHMDDIALILLEHGADPNVKNTRGKTPLHLLLERNFHDYDSIDDILLVAVARLLLERGADVNAQDEDNTTPLDLAYRHRRSEIAQIILHRANAENDRRTAHFHVNLEGKYNF
jgi:ankyrin repeat protein